MRFWSRLVLGMALGALLSAGCVQDRELANPRVGCGDGECQAGEHPGTCPADCKLRTCGNHACEIYENTDNCPEDCPVTVCGNNDCEPGEDPSSCASDCPWNECGNGACEPGETTATCVLDCFSGYCGDDECEAPETANDCPEDCPATGEVDLLFVIDNSGSMADEQAQLRADFPSLYDKMKNAYGHPPDLHIGVVSTDLGTGSYQITYCEDIGGDQGVMADPFGVLEGGVRYFIDVKPEGCDESRALDASGTCGAHDCLPTHCAHEPATQLVVDAMSGCPRCRNFQGDPAFVFSSMADLGTSGCGFEQPLEAMYRALNENPANDGFVRPDAQLTVVILSDEDDCSAKNSELFDPTDSAIDSPLGPLTSYRCFEFGVTCDMNNRDQVGERHDCEARVDGAALLHPVSRYTTLLEGLKSQNLGQLVVIAITGPVIDNTVIVELDALAQPAVGYSCSTGAGGAVPAIRLRDFVHHFNGSYAMEHWAFQSICNSSYEIPFQEIGQTLHSRLVY
ncbi:MAG: hypothetical protein ABI333_01050 [bacterium]